MNPECEGCGITAADLPDGFGLEETFDDGLCIACQQLAPSQRPSAWLDCE